MNNAEIESFLIQRGLKPTPNRTLVLRELAKATHPINLAELEQNLAPMDKASIFRVLELFADKEIVHVIEDGSRSLKYEICKGSHHHDTSDQHAHFYCEKCGAIICLDSIPLPNIELPSEFKLKSVNLMFKGLCPDCNS